MVEKNSKIQGRTPYNETETKKGRESAEDSSQVDLQEMAEQE